VAVVTAFADFDDNEESSVFAPVSNWQGWKLFVDTPRPKHRPQTTLTGPLRHVWTTTPGSWF